MGGHFYPFVESFLGLSSITKFSKGARALAARVAANMAPSGNFREIATVNL